MFPYRAMYQLKICLVVVRDKYTCDWDRLFGNLVLYCRFAPRFEATSIAIELFRYINFDFGHFSPLPKHYSAKARV